ncbi:MAG: uroporphyrinogen decarboxylase family protein [Candidatus Caldatribacteriaceae bacterium]
MASRERALKAIFLQETDRIPHWEFLSNPDFEWELTGINPREHPQKARLRTLELLDIDVEIPPRSDTPVVFQMTEEGQLRNVQGKPVAAWGSGITWAWDHGARFSSLEEILQFDPIEHFLYRESEEIFEDLDPLQRFLHLPQEEMSAKLNEDFHFLQGLVGERALVPGHYYRTLLMWPLMLFGWERFAELVYCYPDHFQRIWKGFAEISLKVMQAFAATDIEVFTSHDDLCMTRGPIFNPEWYRRNLYPYYEKLWEPLKKAGKRIIFISDGKLDAVIDDVLSCGADGFFAESHTDLEALSRRYGKDKVLVGNLDGRILEYGDREDIKREVERCARFGKECPGYFFCVGNHLTHSIPPQNIQHYFEVAQELGQRP